MDISKNTKKILNKIDKISFNKNYNDNLYQIDFLHKKSNNIIKYILNNINIGNIEYNKIKKTNINNITLYILKNTDINNIINKELRQFIVNIKNNTILDDEIVEFVNKNNDIIADFTKNQINKNKSKEIKYIIEQYSDLIISKFIPISVQTNILKFKNYINFNVKIDTNILYFKIYYENNIDNKDLSIIILKALFTIYIYNKTDVTINIMIFLTKNEKKFPYKYQFLGSNEINSGLTSFEQINKICIYRQEELGKVIIHEMIHALGIDSQIFLDSKNKYIENSIKNFLNLSHLDKINLNESFTEASTIIINSLFNSLLCNENIYKILNNEIKFSIIQCSNIVNFYKIKSNWSENTSVLSYYLLKLANIYNIDKFISKFMFNDNIDIFQYYKNLIHNIKLINYFNYNINLDKTLKMGLYEIKFI